MADYYPLLARALDALPDRSPAMRTAVYARARNALLGQLRSLDPPLPEADIELERMALDKAIDRLEVDYGTPPAVPEVVPPPPAPPPPPEPVFQPAPEPVPPVPEPAPPPAAPAFVAAPEPSPEPEPFLPPAAPPSFLPIPEPVPVEASPREAPPREAAVAITARKAKAPEPPPEGLPVPEAPADPIADLVVANDPVNGRQRPRIDVVAPNGGRSRLLRNVFVGIVLTVVIGLIAVAAFLLRDKPASLQPGGAETADNQQPDGADAKFSDRVGGEPAPKPSGGSSAGMAPTGQRAPASPTIQPDLAVAQRAVLIEENTAAPNTAPISTAGRVVWRLDSVPGEQGQPLETAIVGTVSFPEAGLSLTMTIQRNLDQTLPASHTISLVFSPTGPEGEKRAVQDVGLLQAKDDENARGSPVSGLPVRVRENLFLIGLSSLRSDLDRNTDLLLHRPWLDLAIRYSTGQRAVLTFEKGVSGTQAIQGAFDQWR